MGYILYKYKKYINGIGWYVQFVNFTIILFWDGDVCRVEYEGLWWGALWVVV